MTKFNNASPLLFKACTEFQKRIPNSTGANADSILYK